MVLSPVVVGALIQAAVVVILCVGFTFTYMVEKFPNFGHTAIATVGTLVSYSLVRIYGWDPYAAIPVSTFACGLLAVILYIVMVRPIKAAGGREVTLTFAFFALSYVIASCVNIYSYWFLYNRGYPASGFGLTNWDFTSGGYPGIFVVSLPLTALLVVTLWVFLTKVKQGIALRAMAEDEGLAASLGVNTRAIHIMSWFITGALAGLAGGIIPLWRYTGLDANDEFLVLVMAGSVVGGLQSVAGAVLGGLSVALSQKGLLALAIAVFGIGAASYESLYPIGFIILILMLEPEGIMGIFGKPHTPIRTMRIRIRELRNLPRRAREEFEAIIADLRQELASHKPQSR